MRRWMCLFVSLILSLSCVNIPITVTADEAVTVIGANLFENDGFEIVWGGSPWYWSAYPTEDAWGSTSCIKLEQGIVHGGNYAGRINGYDGKTTTSIIMQGVENLIPEGTYRLSFWVYLNSTESSLSLTRYYEGANAYRGLRSVSPSDVSGWTYVESDFVVEEASVRIQFQFLGTADEYVIIDDVSFSLLVPPDKYQLELRDIFNYSENETGMAGLDISDYYYDAEEAAHTKVNFSITDTAGNIVASQNDVSVNSEGKAEFNYSLSNMQLKEKYNLNATVYVDGDEIKTFSKNVYKYNRPTRLTEDGVYMLDGEPFVPVIAYGANNNDHTDYPYLKEIGVNTVHILGYDIENLKPRLELCRQYGMKALIDLGVALNEFGYTNASAYKEAAKEIVEATKYDPVVFAYAQMDEPQLDSETLGLLEEWYTTIRNVDDEHPVYLDQYSRTEDVYVTMGKYCDIQAEDNYPYDDDNSCKSTFVKKAIEQSRKPVYSVLQVFDGEGYFPDAEHIRGQLYRALEEGAKGIAYFSIKATADSRLWATDRWEGLKKFSSDEQSLIFDYFIHNKYPTVDEVDEGIPYGFYSASWYVGDNLYLIAHNRSNSPIERNIPLKNSDKRYELLNISDGSDALVVSDSLNLELEAQEVSFYKITPIDTPTFGEYASFNGISAGAVSSGNLGRIPGSTNNYAQLKLQNCTVKNETGASADGDGAYVSIDGEGLTWIHSPHISISSRVEEGKNYIITFYTKTSAPRDLLIGIRYLVEKDGAFSDWTNSTYHSDYSEKNPDYMTLNDSGQVYTFHKVKGGTYEGYGGYYEGQQLMWVGSDTTTDWVENKIEIHVPHCAAAVNVEILRNDEYVNTSDYIAPCIDAFSIEETDTNIVVNGDFENSASYSATTRVMGRDGLYSGGRYPTGWVGQRGYNAAPATNGYGTFEQVVDGDNTYFKATSAESGMELVQGVWLREGTYKLSFKWKIFDSKNTENTYKVLATLRRGWSDNISSPSYTASNNSSSIEMGMSNASYGWDGSYAAYGSTFEPTRGLGANQTEEDGWVNYEVYFKITNPRAYWLAFGCYMNWSTFAVDDVVLAPVDDNIELRCLADATVTNEDVAPYERTIYNTTTSETVKNWNAYIVYKESDTNGSRNASGLCVINNTSTTDPINGIVITAVYEKDISDGTSRLYSADSIDFSAAAGKVNIVGGKAAEAAPANTENKIYYAKSFLWDSFNKLKPLTGSVFE